MLAKKNRLKEKQDFQKIFRQGEFHSIGGIYLKKVANGLPETRIGFFVEKKFFNKAVDRNRIKRLLREAVREKIGRINTGSDIIIFYRDTTSDKNLKAISSSLERLFKKSNLINN